MPSSERAPIIAREGEEDSEIEAERTPAFRRGRRGRNAGLHITRGALPALAATACLVYAMVGPLNEGSTEAEGAERKETHDEFLPKSYEMRATSSHTGQVIFKIPTIDYKDAAKTIAHWSTPATVKIYDNGIYLPALGWNTWNQYQLDISETIVLNVARSMKKYGLVNAGFQYVVLDDGWAASTRDEKGRLHANSTKFPNGMRKLAEELHSLGLKLGIYTSVGKLTCGAGQPGSMGHHDIDAQTFADWKIDYVKIDRCGWPTEIHGLMGIDPGDVAELTRIAQYKDYPLDGRYPTYFYNETGRVASYLSFVKALNKTGRPIFLEVCDWGEDHTLKWAPSIANSFRMAWDIFPSWDRLAQVHAYFAEISKVAAATRPGAFAFPDMLEVGIDGYVLNRNFMPKANLTIRESASQLALWAMWSSPLILGYDVSDPGKRWVTELLKNKKLLEVDQDPLAVAARRVMLHKEPCTTACMNTEVWVKPLVRGRVAVALVNMAGVHNQTDRRYKAEKIAVSWSSLGLDAANSCNVYSVTEQKSLGVMTGSVAMTVEPHATFILVISP